MAEAVISLAVESIGGLLIQKAKTLYGVRGQVDDLLKDLRHIQRFLKSADAKQYEDEQIRDWVVEIREVAYDAEDVIATFLWKVESRKGSGFKKCFLRSIYIFNEVDARLKIGSQINSVKSDIARLKGSLGSFGLAAAATERAGPSHAPERRTFYFDVEPDFVGFKEDIKILEAKLVSAEHQHHRVVSICGMGGLGKTTLAQKVYEKVRSQFDAIAWVSISQQWQRKDVLQRILTCLNPKESKEIREMIEDQLVEVLRGLLETKKCLVVLDDIWSEKAWDDLLPAFPLANSSSKIMLTTRNKNVATYADPLGFVHEPTCLTNE